jgi:hypothetical protein
MILAADLAIELERKFLIGGQPPHSHSIVPSDNNALI